MLESPDGWLGELTFVLGLAVVTGLTVLVQRRARIPVGTDAVVAVGRAALQLAVVAALLAGVLATGWTVVLFVALMLTTASWTSVGRVAALHRGRRAAVAAVVAGSLVTVALVFGLHLVDWSVRYLLAVAGIVIGAGMSATTLAGRHFATLAADRADQVEGWFALGATPPEAHDDIARTAVREALLPTLDQTRNTGLVTLPGAFVGAIFGGASPVEAAKFQLVVLAGIALTMTVAGIVVTRFASGAPTVARDRP